MLRSRVIPTLLLDGTGLYKTESFREPKYIGDPINTVKIFNEKNVDELTIFDISATTKKFINFELLEKISKEARMPLTYGGGVVTGEQARKLLGFGFEKISVNSAYFENPNILNELSRTIGSQSVVLCIDVKKNSSGEYNLYNNRGKIKIEIPLEQFLKSMEFTLISELIINNITNDGKLTGIDLELLSFARPLVKSHLTMMGGLSGQTEINMILKDHYPIGLAGGACFVFRGKYKAVLINYYKPSIE